MVTPSLFFFALTGGHCGGGEFVSFTRGAGRKCFVFSLQPAVHYLSNWILSRSIYNVVQRPLPADIVDADELQQRGVDEAHAHAVPHVHRRQVRHDRKCTAETV